MSVPTYPYPVPVKEVKKLDQLSNLVACDTETTGLDVWHGDRPFAFSFCDDQEQVAFIRGEVDPFTRKVSLRPKDFESLRKFFSSNRTKVFHNAKFDIRMIQYTGIRVQGPIQDTMYAMHCVNCQERMGLKPLAAKFLDIPKTDESDLKQSVIRARNKGRKLGWALAEAVEADYWTADPSALKKYAVIDAIRTIILWLWLRDRLREDRVVDTYRKEMKLLPITYGMEERGVGINVRILQKELDTHHALAAKFQKELSRTAPNLNLNSSKQMLAYLYDDPPKGLGLPKQYNLKTGQLSTSWQLLSNLSAECPMLRILVKYRMENKVIGSFFGNYQRMLVPDRISKGWHCIHADYQQLGTVTGRYACRRPNLQNATEASTARIAEPISARTAFGPRPGYLWFHFDYSQLEVRVFADLSQEKFLLDAIRGGRDIHAECANKVWGGKNDRAIASGMHVLQYDGSGVGVSDKIKSTVESLRAKYPNLSEEQRVARWLETFGWDVVKAEGSIDKKYTRNRAKVFLFTKLFGGGAKAIKGQVVGCSMQEARAFLQDYDSAFPRIAEFIQETTDQARKDGYIRTVFNRKIVVDEDKAYRSVNYRVQGSAADLLKDRMIAVNEFLKERRARQNLDAWMLMTVHDEVVIEIKKEQAETNLIMRIKEIMEDHTEHFGLNMDVEVAVADQSWAVKKKYQPNEGR